MAGEPAARAVEADPTGALEAFLTYRLHRVNKLTDRDSLRAYLHECGLPLSEGRALAAIGRFAPLSVKDLAQAANLDKAQASRSAQALVQRGMVSKQTSAADGRGVVLALTPAGESAYQDVMAMIARRNAEIFGCLAPVEQQALATLLDRVANHLVATEEGGRRAEDA